MRIYGIAPTPITIQTGIPTAQQSSGLTACAAGNYTELIAATLGASLWITIWINPGANAIVRFYRGAIGAEILLFQFDIQNLAASEAWMPSFPFRITTGTRITCNPTGNCDVDLAVYY